MEKPIKFLDDQGTFNTLFSEMEKNGINLGRINKGTYERNFDDFVITEFEKRQIPLTKENIIVHQEILFTYYFLTSFEEVTSVATEIFNLEKTEIEGSFRGFQIKSWFDDPLLSACFYLENENGEKFSIEINLALIRFCLDIIATLSGVATVVNENGNLIESPILTTDEAIMNINTLIRFYLRESENYVSSSYIDDIGKKLKYHGQFNLFFFMTMVLRFIVAHELGHFIIYKNFENENLKIIRSQALDITWEMVSTVYSNDLEKLNLSEETVKKSWEAEFAADIIALNLLFKRGNNENNLLVFNSVQNLFLIYILLSSYAEGSFNRSHLSGSHPPFEIRFHLIQEFASRELDDQNYEKLLVMGEKTVQFFHKILEKKDC